MLEPVGRGMRIVASTNVMAQTIPPRHRSRAVSRKPRHSQTVASRYPTANKIATVEVIIP